MKKFLIIAVSIILAVAIGGLAAFASVQSGYVVEKRTDNTNVVFSVWGDSIAEAILGASPIGERDGFGFYGLVGRIANFEFHNRAVSGHKTGQFYQHISAADDGSRMNNTLLKTSDIIAISILGNDLLQNDVSQMTVDFANGETTNLDANVAIAREDFYKAIDYVRSVCRPNAKIIVQTVYNPMFAGARTLRQNALDALYAKGLSDADIRMVGNEMLAKLNRIVFDYLADNPGSITILDVNKAFDEIYEKDNHRGAELFYNDGVHPSNEGHAVMAGLYLEKMVEWGYISESEVLREYKKIRVDQVERLYTKQAGVKEAKKEIKKAETYDQVTNSFFRFAEDKVAVLDKKATEKNSYKAFEETKRYYVSKADILNDTVSTLLYLILDSNKSYVEFYTDGTMKLQLMLKPNFATAISGYLDKVDLSTVDITPIVEQYAVELFPGFTTDRVEYSLGLLKDNLGLSIAGLDYEHEGVKSLVDSLEQTGKLPATLLSLPEGLGIVYEGRYTLREEVNRLTGETMQAIHMGAPYENGDGYIIMTLTENEKGKEMVNFKIDFIQAYLEAVEK